MPDMPKISSLGDACCGCGACAAACPASCVSMGTDACGFSYPAVDGSACVGCGRCEELCPQHISIRRDLVQVTAQVEEFIQK